MLWVYSTSVLLNTGSEVVVDDESSILTKPGSRSKYIVHSGSTPVLVTLSSRPVCRVLKAKLPVRSHRTREAVIMEWGTHTHVEDQRLLVSTSPNIVVNINTIRSPSQGQTS